MRRLLTALALVVAMVAWAPQAQADDGYPPDVPTECTLDAPITVAGKRVVLEATVSANTTDTVTGTVKVSIAKGRGNGRDIWSTTERYDGSPLRIEGPRLARGSYSGTMRFTPDSDLYGGCADDIRFQVGSGEVGGEDSGVLPDTGGPHLMFLLLGLGLVTAGGGILTQARRTA